jgi:hypothetical protein
MPPQRRWRSRLGGVLRSLASVLDPTPGGDEGARRRTGAGSGPPPEETSAAPSSDTWNFDLEDAPAHWVNRLREAGLVRGSASAVGTKGAAAGNGSTQQDEDNDVDTGVEVDSAWLGRAGLPSADVRPQDSGETGADRAAWHVSSPDAPDPAPAHRRGVPRSGLPAAGDGAPAPRAGTPAHGEDAALPATVGQPEGSLQQWPADGVAPRRRLLVGQPSDGDPGRRSGRESGGPRPDAPAQELTVRSPDDSPDDSAGSWAEPSGNRGPQSRAADPAEPPSIPSDTPSPGGGHVSRDGVTRSVRGADTAGSVPDTVGAAAGAMRRGDRPALDAARYPGRHHGPPPAEPPAREPDRDDHVAPVPEPRPHPWPDLRRDPVPVAPPVNPLAIARALAREARLADEQTAV